MAREVTRSAVRVESVASSEDVVARPDTTEQAQVSAEIPYADESEGCGRDPHYVPPEDVARLFQITFEVRDVVHASLDAGAAASPATDAARAQDADRPRSTPEAGAERSGDATSEGGSVSDAGATQIDGPLVTARGSLLDARDGRRYATVTLGRQTWMAESLDYGPQQRGIQASVVPTDDSSVEKYCVDDDPEQCQRVGGLYSWPEALALPAACVETLCLGRTVEVHQGICPQGWHVPSFVEWSELALYLAGRLGFPDDDQNAAWSSIYGALKSTQLWPPGTAGSDESGFDALPNTDWVDTDHDDRPMKGALFHSSEEASEFGVSGPALCEARADYSAFAKAELAGVRCVQDR